MCCSGVEVRTTKNKSKEKQKEIKIKEERVGVPFYNASTLDEPFALGKI